MQRGMRATGGFTLTELLTVIAIGGILAMLGAPSLGGLLARTRTASAAASIAGTLRAARTAAVMHNARMLLCPSPDGRQCGPGGTWRRGWLVAADTDHDGQPDAGTAILQTQPSLPAGTNVITSDGRGHVAFQPSGSAGGSNVTFTVCHAGQAQGRSIVVANSGRVRVAEPDPQRLADCLAGTH
ncbi:MAG TPA: GspH/FimT family pseudopilin [Rhodanobacteraceae bacterium]